MIHSFADKVQLQRGILKKYVLICFHPNIQGKRLHELVLLCILVQFEAAK